MISVCMATYNGAAYLKKQLESILAQLEGEDELIISDDGSTDTTLRMIKELNSPRIRLFEKAFRDPVRNFEFALQQSAGSLIALADQDDIWLPNKRTVILRHLAQSDKKAILMNGHIIDGHGETSGDTTFERWRSRTGFLNNIIRNTYMGSSMAFTADLKPLLLPFPPSIAMHDWWIGLLVEKIGTMELVREPTIQYRIHGQNRSLNGSALKEKIRWRYQMLIAVHQRLAQIKGS